MKNYLIVALILLILFLIYYHHIRPHFSYIHGKEAEVERLKQQNSQLVKDNAQLEGLVREFNEVGKKIIKKQN